MLRVELFDQISELYSLSFIKREGETLIIAPDPRGADHLRETLTQKVSTFTLAKFMSDELLKFTKNTRMRKSELMLLLSHFFHQFMKDAPSGLFFQAFDHFTEFRGYTLDYSLIAEASQDLPPDVNRGIELFYSLSEKLDIIDEQRSYAMLADFYRAYVETEDPPPFKNIVFWGFSFLSAREIDLLKSLSIYFDVYLPFSRTAYGEAMESDWISWLTTEKSVVNKKIEEKHEIEVCRFPSKRMSEYVRPFLSKNVEQIILASHEVDFHTVREIVGPEHFFESEAEIFTERKRLFFKKLHNFIAFENRIHELDQFVTSIKNHALKNRDFILVKVILSFESIFKRLADQGISIKSVDLFMLAIWERVVELDLPRLSIIPLSYDDKYSVIGLGELLYLDDRAPETFIVASSVFTSLKGKEVNRPRGLETLLRSLGPIRRVEFDFFLLKERMKPLLSRKGVTLFLEQDIEHKDPAWADLLSSYVIKERSPALKEMKGVREDPLNRFIKGIIGEFDLSATSLQKYVECPRSFYLTYVSSFFPFVSLKNELSMATLGSLEHRLIRNYFETHDSYSRETLTKLARTIFDDTIKREELSISLVENEAKFDELVDYSEEALLLLLEIKSKIPEASFLFEHQIPNSKGRADLFVLIPNGDLMLIDFKRSEGSIPDKKSFVNFESVQLWYYHKRLAEKENRTTLLGYLNLSLPSKSLLFDLGLSEELRDSFIKRDIKLHTFESPFMEIENTYDEFELRTVKRLFEDKEFLPIPLSADSCKYCFVKNLCPKLGADDGSE